MVLADLGRKINGAIQSMSKANVVDEKVLILQLGLTSFSSLICGMCTDQESLLHPYCWSYLGGR